MITAALHLATVALLCFLVGDVPPLVFAASLLLALLPDTDTPKSLIGSLLRPISRLLERRIGHRTVTHSLLALGLVAGVASIFAPAWWLAIPGSVRPTPTCSPSPTSPLPPLVPMVSPSLERAMSR